MIKSSIERVARNRYGMPIILALALIMVVVNESSYQHSRSTLAQGITLSDARQKAARTLQALTDAESAARAFMLGAQQVDLANYREAINEMEGVQQDAFQRLTELDPQRTVSVDDVRKRIEERVAKDKYLNTSELNFILRDEIQLLLSENNSNDRRKNS